MKKIFGLTIAALLIIGIVGGGTLAYFSDTETSTGNTWTAGTLNLVDVISGTAVNNSISINGGTGDAADGLNDKVEFGLTDPIKPGSSGNITWTLSNTGTVSGNLTISANTTFSEGTDTAPELALPAAGLDSKIDVVLTRGVTTVYTGTMSGLAAALSAENQSMAGGGGSLVYVLNWQILTTVGNEIQGDTATLNITFTLTQN